MQGLLMNRPLLVDVLDARKYVARINDYPTCEGAAQALAAEFDRVRRQGEELATEALLDAFDRGFDAAIFAAKRDLQAWARYIGSRPEGEAVAGHIEETIAVVDKLRRPTPPSSVAGEEKTK